MNMDLTQKCILVVEDHASIRHLLGQWLSKSYSVITRKNGLEAMAWLAQGHRPDLVVLDLEMPGLGGMEFLKQLRLSGFFEDLPVIVVSGLEEPEIQEMAEAQGIEAFVCKPFNPLQLKRLIEAALQRAGGSLLKTG
ncbi:MAG: response regulator [Bacteroidetes bacterium]|nr:MAG: response regulator [Bacteroidota bacterium]